jgi:hypothetical protein
MTIKKESIRLSTILILLCSQLIFCSRKVVVPLSGLVNFKIYITDVSSGIVTQDQNYFPDCRTWYRDSVIIQEQVGIKLKFGSFMKEIGRGVDTSSYVYIDLKKMHFYEYASFSDTATLVRSYNRIQADTISWPPRWRFYKQEPTLSKIVSVSKAFDTSINNKSYSCIKVTSEYKNDTSTNLLFFDCSKINTIFSMRFINLRKNEDCPMVLSYGLPAKNDKWYMISKLEFTRDSLTRQELKVFKSWQQNAIKKPVVD